MKKDVNKNVGLAAVIEHRAQSDNCTDRQWFTHGQRPCLFSAVFLLNPFPLQTAFTSLHSCTDPCP